MLRGSAAAVRGRSVFLAILVLTFASLSATAQEELYEDPEGRFTVPVPTNWQAQPMDDAVRLSPSEGDVAVHLTVVEGSDLDAAIEEAWQRVAPEFEAEVDQRQEPPADENVEQRLALNYDVGEERLAQALAQLKDERVYVLLIRGELAAVQRRASQIGVIQSGLTLEGQEEVDLGGEEPRPIDDELLQALDTYVQEGLERFEVPGASVVVVRGGEVVHGAGFGVRDRESGAPVTPETTMMIGSTTKTMTTMMMGSVVDDGLLSWDTPVVEVLPSFSVADPELTEQITVQNLVCACTGVPRRDLELIFNAEDLGADQVLASLADFEFFTDFGEAFQYSNQLVATGGYAGAVAARPDDGPGDLYETYVRVMDERILGPIGMEDATFSFAEVRGMEDRGTPYGLRAGFEQVRLPLSAERFVQALAPAGGLWSDANDLGRYMITLLQEGVAPDGTRVISEENLHHTWEPQVPVSADADYGLGWLVGEYKGLQVLSHGGNTLGFTADLAIVPEAEVGIAVLTNRRASSAFNEAIRMRFLELLYEQPTAFDEQATFAHEQMREQLRSLDEDLEAEVDAATVEPFLGRYGNDALGEVRLSLDDDGALTLDAGAFVSELRPRLNDDGEVEAYVMVAPPLPELPVRFERGGADGDGTPQLRVGQGATQYTFEPVAP